MLEKYIKGEPVIIFCTMYHFVKDTKFFTLWEMDGQVVKATCIRHKHWVGMDIQDVISQLKAKGYIYHTT